MHDYIISSYNINFEDKTIKICAQDRKEERMSHFIAREVLTHSFQNILEYNIILDIEECNIDNFIKDNLPILKKKIQECWPVDYQNIQGLKDFLIRNDYKYIKIISSYGMNGWVLAKAFKIT